MLNYIASHHVAGRPAHWRYYHLCGDSVSSLVSVLCEGRHHVQARVG